MTEALGFIGIVWMSGFMLAIPVACMIADDDFVKALTVVLLWPIVLVMILLKGLRSIWVDLA